MHKTKLEKCEQSYNRAKNPRLLVVLAMRHWLSYRISGDKTLLHRANYLAVWAAQNGSLDPWLMFMQGFFNIELGQYSSATENLEKIAQYKNYFKANRPVYYGAYLFLEALIDLRTGKHRAAEKHFKILSEFSEGQSHHSLPLMLGWILLESEELPRAWAYFSEAAERGNQSVFLYERAYEYLQTGAPITESPKLLLGFINWSMTQSLDINAIIEFYQEAVISAAIESPTALESIYAKYPDESILTSICRNYIREDDYSDKAYFYYHEAELKQLDIPVLHQTLVRSAYKRGIEDVTRYTMSEFLKSGAMDSDIELKAYVYHLILTSKRLREFVQVYSGGILQFCMYCLENNLRGRYFNSIYKYFLEKQRTPEVPREIIKKAEGFIMEDLFSYRVQVSRKVRHIWIIEKEKKGAVGYDLQNGEAVVRATSEFFSYVCFGEGVKNIEDEKIKISKLVENADIALFTHFYKRGSTSADILITLARHVMSMEKLTDDQADILEAAAKQKVISTAFKMQLLARLGDFYYNEKDLVRALEFYCQVDENLLNDKYIQRMLAVFLATGEYQRAAWLIAKKSANISDKVLFQALKHIVRKTDEQNRLISATAYRLLLSSWYDPVLLEVALKHYKGSQSEWEELGKTLTLMSVQNTALDALILSNSMWIRRPDAESQRVYCRMYRDDPENELIGLYTYYLTFELMINSLKPEYDTIGVMESIFRRYSDQLLAYALCTMYLVHGIATVHSDEILAKALDFMEQDGLILPVLKACQDKKVSTPYIEKYQTFSYKGLPDKNVYLYYKVDGEADYRPQKMPYFRFGLYFCIVPHFYGERLQYYFSEEMPTGSITTKESTIDNSRVYLDESAEDQYFVINNALIYEHMFKYERVEGIITESLRDLHVVKAGLM